jgi:hypothetical protein
MDTNESDAIGDDVATVWITVNSSNFNQWRRAVLLTRSSPAETRQ